MESFCCLFVDTYMHDGLFLNCLYKASTWRNPGTRYYIIDQQTMWVHHMLQQNSIKSRTYGVRLYVLTYLPLFFSGGDISLLLLPSTTKANRARGRFFVAIIQHSKAESNIKNEKVKWIYQATTRFVRYGRYMYIYIYSYTPLVLEQFKKLVLLMFLDSDVGLQNCSLIVG